METWRNQAGTERGNRCGYQRTSRITENGEVAVCASSRFVLSSIISRVDSHRYPSGEWSIGVDRWSRKRRSVRVRMQPVDNSAHRKPNSDGIDIAAHRQVWLRNEPIPPVTYSAFTITYLASPSKKRKYTAIAHVAFINKL